MPLPRSLVLVFATAGCGTPLLPAPSDASSADAADTAADAAATDAADVASPPDADATPPDAAADVVVPPVEPCATADAPWPTAGGCYGRRYASSLPGPSRLPHALWQTAPGPDTEVAASVDTVYQLGEFLTLKAYRSSDGTFLWDSANLGFSIGGVPSIDASGALDVWVSSPGTVFSIAPSGAPGWQTAAGSSGSAGYDGSPALGADGSVYVAGAGITALTAAGAIRWHAEAARSLEDAMIANYADGESIVARETSVPSPLLIAVRPDGTTRFSYPVDLDQPHTQSMFACGALVVANRDGATRAIDAVDGTGQRIWRAEPFAGGAPYVAFASNGQRIYVGAFSFAGLELAVLDCAGHVLRHQADFGGPVTVDGAGNVFGLCAGYHPCAIDATGANLWTLAAATNMTTPRARFAILSGGRLAVSLPSTASLLQLEILGE